MIETPDTEAVPGPSDDDIQYVVAEIQGRTLPEMTDEQREARDRLHQKHQAELEAFRLERELEAWAEQERQNESARRRAEQEAREERARAYIKSRESAERMARESRERASLRAAEDASRRTAQMQQRLAQLEAQEIQRQRNAAVWATVGRLGESLVPRVDPVMQRLDELEARIDEEPYDPSRRFKFDWQP